LPLLLEYCAEIILIIICKESGSKYINIQQDNQLDSLDSERDLMQARQGDLIVINCKSDGEQGQYLSTFETFMSWAIPENILKLPQ